MALTRIKRHMIADSAVMPNNLVSTATYTVGAVTASGAITGTNLVATGSVTAPTQVTTPKITVSGSSGFTVDTLRVNTGSWITYYNPTSKEMTYGPITGTTGTLAVYDQSLNTTDKVTFAGVAATTATITTATVSGALNLGSGSINISSANGFRVSGVKVGSQTQVMMLNTSTGEVTYFASPGQVLSTSGSPTFANLTVTSVLKAGGNIYPTTQGTNGQFLKTNGSGTLSWADTASYDQDLNTSDSVKFYGIQVQTDISNSPTISFRAGGGAGQLYGYIQGTSASPLDSAYGSMSVSGVRDANISGGSTDFRVSGSGGGGYYAKVTVSSNTWTFKSDGALQFPDNTSQSTAFAGFNQPSTTATFNTLYVSTGSQIDYSGGIRGGRPGAGGDLYLFAGSAGYNGVIRFNASYLEPACSIIPPSYVNVNLGSSTNRWNKGYIRTLYVGTSTIYFEDENNLNTSTFSIASGTIAVDGAVVLDQSVAAGSSPTFSTVAMTTSTVNNFEVSNTFVANSSTVQIYDYTMPTEAATTSGWAMTSNGSGAIEFQPAVLSTNITIDGGFANSVYTSFDYAIDGGGASA